MEIVRGTKLWLIILCLCVGLLLSSLESTIVATALVSIGSDFKSYERSNWVVISYLLVYSSFLIIFARLSDISGRKSALLTGLIFFTVASLACGLAHTLNQLIIFRAFQGLGGSGVYAVSMVVCAEITPPEQLGMISGLMGTVFAVASAVGPVIGGAITSSSTWRWCFYLNVPSGTLITLLISVIFPPDIRPKDSFQKSLLRIDWIGCVLCLAASIIIVIPLQEGGGQLPWNSTPIIAMFIVGGSSWGAFAAWETWLAHHPRNRMVLPVLPVRVATHRVIGICILTAFMTGLAFTSTIVYLPQRFQVVHSLSPIQAGTKMLPLVITSALSYTITGILLGQGNVCAYLVVLGNVLQLAGLGLLSSLHNKAGIVPAEYGYQVVLGLGLGMTLCASFILARIEVDRKDIAPIMGAITQLRVFGGVVGVAFCRIILSSHVKAKLSHALSPNVLSSIMASVASIDQLPLDQAAHVREVYSDGFSSQSRILMYTAAANVLVSLFTIRRHAKPIREPTPTAVAQTQKEEGDV